MNFGFKGLNSAPHWKSLVWFYIKKLSDLYTGHTGKKTIMLYKVKNLTHEPSRRSVALEGNSKESGSHVVTPISTLPLHEFI
jgi:hypothetical protein